MNQANFHPSNEQLALFEKLHASRASAFETFNQKAFRGVWSGVINKYPESAHFIYELLQNADDAEATWVEITVNPFQLLFKHNGTKHFNVTEEDAVPVGDINAITGIGDSSKYENTNKIGKFGVGFKAVFQYTDVPEIYDDTFKFKIENYIIPVLIETDHPGRNEGETLFVLPFKDDSNAFEIIVNKLKNLHNPLLFLPHLERIKLIVKYLDDRRELCYEKKLEESEDCDKQVKLLKYHLREPKKDKTVLLFAKYVTIENRSHPIFVGYYYDESKRKIITESNQKIFCFFPTKESFKSCFISHAPFLLTDNRQNLKPNEKINTILIKYLAKLAAQSLVYLRDYGLKRQQKLIDENLAELVPYYNHYGWEQSEIFEKPMQDAFLDVVTNKNLFMSREGTYIKANQSFIGKPHEIMRLLNKVHLSDLTGVKSADFLKYELSQSLEKSNIYKLLKDSIKTFDSSDLAKSITADFMSRQDHEWVVAFYNYLKENASKLWKIIYSMTSLEMMPFRTAPIVKTQSGEWVAPYKHDNTLNVFFPLAKRSSGSFRFVHLEYVNDESAKSFLDELGIKEPDENDFVINTILPKYRTSLSSFTQNELKEDFEVIYKLFKKLRNNSNRNDLIAHLKDDYRLMGIDGNYYRLNDLFFPNPLTQEYIKYSNYSIFNFSEYQFNDLTLDNDEFAGFLLSLGINKCPKVVEVRKTKCDDFDKDVWSEIPYILGGKDFEYQDFELQCFESVVIKNRMTKELSVYIWNEILPSLNFTIYETMKFSYLRKKARLNRDFGYCISSFLYLLKNKKWVYDKTGKKRAPKKLFLEDLDDDYDTNNGFVINLGVKKREKTICELGGTVEQQKVYDLGKQIMEMVGVMPIDGILDCIRKEITHRKSEAELQPSVFHGSEDTLLDPLTSLEQKWQKKSAKEVKKPKSAGLSGRTSVNADFSNQQTNTMSQPFFDETGTTVPVTLNDMTTSSTEKRLKERCSEAQNTAQNASDQVAYFDLLLNTEQYTFKWFKILMELMHNGKTNMNQRSARIDFFEWHFENDGKLLCLSNPSQQVPLWMADADCVVVKANSPKSSDKIECVLARCAEYGVDLSVELSDEICSMLEKARKVCLIAEESVSFLDSFQTNFLRLGFDDDFNMSQNLPKDITFIYGPPGTGKTTKIVQMVKDTLCKAEKDTSILILTPTNKAADVVAEKMLADDVCSCHLTRFGATESLDLISTDGVVGSRDTTYMKASGHDIIVTTAARYAYDYVQPNETLLCEYPWDYIVIDEASMMDVLSATFILFKGKDSKIIVSGDPMQIQPVVQNNMPAYNIYDLVGLHGLADALGSYVKHPVVALTEQHRSIPSIGDVVSRFAYDGLVVADKNRAPQKPLELDGMMVNDINFIGYDVADFDLIRELGAVGGSAFQLYAAIFTYNMAEYMVKQITSKYPQKDYSIGIVCPYKAEADAIKQMLDSRPIGTEYCKVICGTVHGFQGDECDIVFVVLNPPAICGKDSHINNKNIINVAMSRARDYLFFIVPNGQQKGFTMKNDLGKLLNVSQKQVVLSSTVEKIMFGSADYICSNTHVRCHMPVNVYCEDVARYEVRMSDDAIDIRIYSEKR